MTQFIVQLFDLTTDELLAFAVASGIVNYYLVRNKGRETLDPLAAISGILAVAFFIFAIATSDLTWTGLVNAITIIVLYWSILFAVLALIIAVVWDSLVVTFKKLNGKEKNDKEAISEGQIGETVEDTKSE